MKSKRNYNLVAMLFYGSVICSQTIELHSIKADRQDNGDQGYTLDGNKMTSSRAKLLNPVNFGPSGTYKKPIHTTDEFQASGSMIEITKLPVNDLFFFGFFNDFDQSTAPFTSNEVDSLYSWSKRGGKVIITSGLGWGATYSSKMLCSKWGYKSFTTIDPRSATVNQNVIMVPDTSAFFSDLWNRPFGSIPGLYQAGSLQGYFSIIPANSVVLSRSFVENKLVVIMDCITLDLLIADVDVYTNNPGTVSGGDLITNDNDKFLANSIAFMDKLQAPPFLKQTGELLSVNSEYLDYKWYRNGQLIEGADTNSYRISSDGSYQVEVMVNGGCRIKSDAFYFEPECDVLFPLHFLLITMERMIKHVLTAHA